uniref:Uncharacterized protein n=1 Tax=Chelonoidis abingdonii TaxID=106734 RepID=A0A8C0IX62_CHEAB
MLYFRCLFMRGSCETVSQALLKLKYHIYCFIFDLSKSLSTLSKKDMGLVPSSVTDFLCSMEQMDVINLYLILSSPICKTGMVLPYYTSSEDVRIHLLTIETLKYYGMSPEQDRITCTCHKNV